MTKRQDPINHPTPEKTVATAKVSEQGVTGKRGLLADGPRDEATTIAAGEENFIQNSRGKRVSKHIFDNVDIR